MHVDVVSIAWLPTRRNGGEHVPVIHGRRPPVSYHVPISEEREQQMAKFAASVLAFTLLALSLSAQDRGPSTPEERAQALQFIRALENDPLHRDARAARGWLTTWIATIPDITVQLCGEFVKPLLGADKNYSAEIFTQSMFSSTAFVIEHPDQKDDAEAKYLAGLEGSLRAYESIRKSKPKVRWALLDELIAKREAGQLAEYVRETMPKCTN